MGFRFYRRVKIIPGVWLNFSKSGVSTSFGVRGARLTVGKNGVRTTVGIPGSGLSCTNYVRHPQYPAVKVVFCPFCYKGFYYEPAMDGKKLRCLCGRMFDMKDAIVQMQNIPPRGESSGCLRLIVIALVTIVITIFCIFILVLLSSIFDG